MGSRKPPEDENDANLSDDERLWRAVTHDVTPIARENVPKMKKAAKNSAKSVKIRPKNPEFIMKEEKIAAKTLESAGKDVDSRNLERFRKGKMPIEGRIDLHGMNQDTAHRTLERFILSAYGAGKRCVLVITGKGDRERAGAEHATDWMAPRPGILRERVPEWLRDVPLGPLVLQTAQAQAKDGGSGALYVLLRRKR